MKCPNCQSDFIWGGDHTFEAHGLSDDGIVANFSCENSECEVTALIFIPHDVKV
jgi:hypothetical protein